MVTRRRCINALRRAHGGTWRYERDEYAVYLHVESGRRVKRCAALDGSGDDGFELQLRWADTGERAEWGAQ